MIIMRMRKSMKSTVARVFLMFVALAVLGGYGIARMLMKSFGRSIDGIASVNGVDISTREFQHAVYEEDQKITLIRQRYGAQADLYMKLFGVESNTKTSALKQLVTKELVKQLGDSFSLELADQYIDEKLANPSFVKSEIGHLLPRSLFSEDGTINVYALTQFMAQPEMSAIRTQLAEKLKSQFILLINQSANYVPEFFSKDMYIGHHVAKKFSVQKFDINHFRHKAKAEDATKEELRNFYEKKSSVDKWYWVPEQRFGIAWEFSASDFGIKITDAEVEEYYTKNKTTRYVEKPAQFKVREIIFNQSAQLGTEGLRKEAEKTYAEVIVHPEKFADIAKEVSQNKATSVDGGLVGYFARGTKDKEYEKAMVRLKNDGDITSVVKTAEGFAIIQRVDRKEPVFSSLQSVKDSIVKVLTEQKFRRTFTRDADKVAKEHNEDALQAFIKKYKGHKKNVGPIKKSTENDFQRIFSLRNEGDATVCIEDGKGIVLKLTEKKAKHLPAFSTMVDQIAHDYEEERAYLLLQKAIATAQALAHKSGHLVAVEGTKIEETHFIDPEKKEAVLKLVQENGYPDGFMTLTYSGQTIFEANKKGGILIMLDELKNDDLIGYETKKLQAQGEAYSTIHNLFTSACLASLFRTATISVNEELIHGKDTLL